MAKKKIHIENTVRRLRFNNNEMTQQELADLVGISRQTVVAIEKYKYTPSSGVGVQNCISIQQRDTRSFLYW